MRTTMTTRRDLRNWVDNATSDWLVRADTDVDNITDAIQVLDHPAWGTDWTAWLDRLPDLTDLLPTTRG